MNAKEQADKLVQYHNSKDHAVITVDQILVALHKGMGVVTYQVFDWQTAQIKYWETVRTEIKKL